MNDVKFYLDAAEKKLQEAVDFLDDTLAHIRAGKANVKILDGIRVNYYGSPVPIDNVANGPAHHRHHAVGAQHDRHH